MPTKTVLVEHTETTTITLSEEEVKAAVLQYLKMDPSPSVDVDFDCGRDFLSSANVRYIVASHHYKDPE
jgi:hypothetical protein